MLVYEKKVNNERHLYGTLTNVPSIEDDQLTYKDTDGDIITPIPGDTYRDNKQGGIIRESDRKAVNVFIGDKCIIGKVQEKVVTAIKVSGPTKVSYLSGDILDLTGLIVTAVYADGDENEVFDYITAPAAGVALTTENTLIKVTYKEFSKDIAITVKVREAKTAAAVKEALALGGEVKLTGNINATEVLTINKDSVLDLNNKTITLPASNENLDWLLLVDGGTLKLSNGSIDASDGGAYGIYVKNFGSVELTDVNLKGDTEALQVKEGSALINSGTYEAKPWDDGQGGDPYRYTLNLIDSAHQAGTGSITVKGGKFFKYDPSDSSSEQPHANFVAPGYKVITEGDYKVVVAE